MCVLLVIYCVMLYGMLLYCDMFRCACVRLRVEMLLNTTCLCVCELVCCVVWCVLLLMFVCDCVSCLHVYCVRFVV